MSALEHQNKKNTFAIQVNSYLEVPDHTHLLKIETSIEEYFEVDKAEIWFYADDTLTAPDNIDRKIGLSRSLTYDAIVEKKTQIENHIKSSRNFEQKIDNPNNVNAKALLVYPVMDGSVVIGIVKLFMLIGNSRVFNKQKEEALKSFHNCFYHLFVQKPIDTNILYLADKTPSSENNSALAEELQQWKERYTQLLTKSEEKLKLYEERDKEQNETIRSLQSKLQNIEQNGSETETVITSLRNKLQSDEKYYKRNLKKYKEIVQGFEKKETAYQAEISELHTLVEKLQKKKSVAEPSADTQKAEEKKSPKLPETSQKETAEMIIQKTVSHINRHQNMRILFDLTLFASSSADSAAHMERVLDSTQFIKKLIEKHSLKHSVPVKKYKHHTEQTIEMIRSYQETIFQNILNIQIRQHKEVPAYLYCDAVKMQHVVMYLLIDLFEIADKKQPVYIDIRYEKKILTFKIKAKTAPKKKTEQSRFKKSAFFKSDAPRLCLQFAHKLAKYLNGEITNSVHEDGYTHLFRISASDSVIE